MHSIDWIVLCGTLLAIVLYGVWKTRSVSNTESFLLGDRELKWYTIGLSIMATQASAITFLSTPGKAFQDGMGFAQFYFGLPIAMVLLAAFVLPHFYKLKVYTAYEFLEGRFGLPTRTLAALFFLLQRGLAAGLTIFAPAIILSSILGWPLWLTNITIGVLVIVYTVAGGTNAVSQTQKQQMILILTGMVIAGCIAVFKFPKGVGISDALHIAGKMGKLQIIDTQFSFENRYNIWSGLLASTFLFLSYFGADQSQVQRYLSGRSLAESRVGLLFNGIIKVPMQLLVLFTGILVFLLFQFEKAPIHFIQDNVQMVASSDQAPALEQLQDTYDSNFELKSAAVLDYTHARDLGDQAAQQAAIASIQQYDQAEKQVRAQMNDLIKSVDEDANTRDGDYVFLTFVITYLPVGLVGLLLAVIFSAAMSSTASEINALATTTVVDIYRRSLVPGKTDAHYLSASKFLTVAWGCVALIFASVANRFDNLIEAVNIVGSLFYGTTLGIFMVAFFFKSIGGRAVFIAALIAEAAVILLYFMNYDGGFYLGPIKMYTQLTYLWLVPVGSILVVILGYIFEAILPGGKNTQVST